MEEAAVEAGLSETIASLLVTRHGKLAFERYFNGHANNVHSLSKSILYAPSLSTPFGASEAVQSATPFALSRAPRTAHTQGAPEGVPEGVRAAHTQGAPEG